MPDGRLLHLRDTCPIETAWAPKSRWAFPRKRGLVRTLTTPPLTVAPRSSALAPPRHLVRGILREDDLQAGRREPERAQETDGPPRSTRCPETGLAAKNGRAGREALAGQDLPRIS